MRVTDPEQASDLVHGLAFLGTGGGGGRLQDELDMLLAAIEAGEAPELVTLDELPDDSWTAAIASLAGWDPDAPPSSEHLAQYGLEHERFGFVERHGRTAVGLSGVPHTRFRGLVRLLERYAAGEEVDAPERPPDVTTLQYLRYVCDDLKAFYREARLAQYPSAEGPALEAWFWQETAMGDLIRRVRDRVQASGDPYTKMIVFGIARV